ncbi:MAG: EFR1 family ferrodoxin [Clostridia bacterium]|nr:EFR1 family ferrodoxin [Clostridia bacterium]
MIFYFSGTGNSKYVAEQIAKITGDEIVSINDKLKQSDTSDINANDKLVFVVPTYSWRIPRVVRDWILKTDFEGTKNAWFVMTCGSEIGNAEKYNKQLCKEKGFVYMGSAQVVMPENYIAMFNSPTQEKIEEIFNKADAEIQKVANLVLENNSFSTPRNNLQDKFMSGPVNMLFYPMFVKAKDFYADDKCTNCGKCVKVCPLNNIEIKNNKPVWNKNCTHCMACISYCPTSAIEYGKKTVGKQRYKCER